ncbi:MAG: hypothetical protein DHS20C16_19530 [Phycisphaerae bacterium]|nr:MAG: hypothetical protein DHS20C16_19530 [Phycisphaerae bacterium]
MFEEMVATGFIAADYVLQSPLEDLYDIFVKWVESGIGWELIASEA